MTIPTEGEEFAKLIEHIRKAQEITATLSHLEGLNSKSLKSRGWLAISEQLKKMQHVVTQIATGKMH